MGILQAIREKLANNKDEVERRLYTYQDRLMAMNLHIQTLEEENKQLRLELRRYAKGNKCKEIKYDRHKKRRPR